MNTTPDFGSNINPGDIIAVTFAPVNGQNSETEYVKYSELPSSFRWIVGTRGCYQRWDSFGNHFVYAKACTLPVEQEGTPMPIDLSEADEAIVHQIESQGEIGQSYTYPLDDVAAVAFNGLQSSSRRFEEIERTLCVPACALKVKVDLENADSVAFTDYAPVTPFCPTMFTVELEHCVYPVLGGIRKDGWYISPFQGFTAAACCSLSVSTPEVDPGF